MRLLIESCRDQEHLLARFHALERGGQGAFGSIPHPSSASSLTKAKSSKSELSNPSGLFDDPVGKPTMTMFGPPLAAALQRKPESGKAATAPDGATPPA